MPPAHGSFPLEKEIGVIDATDITLHALVFSNLTQTDKAEGSYGKRAEQFGPLSFLPSRSCLTSKPRSALQRLRSSDCFHAQTLARQRQETGFGTTPMTCAQLLAYSPTRKLTKGKYLRLDLPREGPLDFRARFICEPKTARVYFSSAFPKRVEQFPRTFGQELSLNLSFLSSTARKLQGLLLTIIAVIADVSLRRINLDGSKTSLSDCNMSNRSSGLAAPHWPLLCS
jgi:hypothetical protein